MTARGGGGPESPASAKKIPAVPCSAPLVEPPTRLLPRIAPLIIIISPLETPDSLAPKKKIIFFSLSFGYDYESEPPLRSS